MELHGVHFPEDAIAAFCQRNGVARLSLFGSILRDDFGPESDVDVLVEFQGAGPSLLGFAGMQVALTELIGREVHLNTLTMLPPTVRGRIAREARVQYVAA